MLFASSIDRRIYPIHKSSRIGFILTLLGLVLGMSLTGIAQNAKPVKVQGLVIDLASKEPLAYLTLTFKKDTVILKRLVSDLKGAFEYSHTAGLGTFHLEIKSMSYETLTTSFEIKEGMKELLLDTFKMKESAVLLDEVVVKDSSPVRFKGDTIIFNAGAFGADALDDIEMLMQRIPGFEIDEQGNIKYNGQSIGILTVDGFRFFGGAPTTATRGLKVDMIESIEFVLSRTEESILSGFDDGVRIPKLNLVLKEERKKFFMSNIHSSLGSSALYAVGGYLRHFNKGNQLGVSIYNNNNGGAGTSSSNGIMMVSNNLSQGLRNQLSGADFNFVKAIGKRKQLNIESQYVFSLQDQTNERITSSQDPILDEWLYTQRQNYTENGSYAHRLNQMIQYKFKNNTTFHLSFSGSLQQSDQSQVQQFQTQDAQQSPVNAGDQRYQTSDFSPNASVNANYTYRLPFKWGFLSSQFSGSLTGSTQRTLNETLTSFQKEELWTDSVFQQQGTHQSKGYSMQLQSSYSIRIDSARGLSFSTSATFSNVRSDRDQATLQYNPITGRYDLLVPFLNAQFQSYRRSYSQPFSLIYSRKKVRVTLTGNLRYLFLQGDHQSAENALLIERKDWILTPSFSFNFSPREGERIEGSASQSVNQPDINSLQPIYNNTNPLFIQEGNPHLQNTSTYLARMQWNRQFKNTTYFAFSIQNTWNKRVIAQSTSIDSVSRIQTTRPINMKGGRSMNMNGNIGFPFKGKWKFMGASVYMGWSANRNFYEINQLLNQLDSRSLSGGMGVNIQLKPWTFGLNQGLSLNNSKNSIQNKADQHYSTYSPSATLTYRPQVRWFFSSSYSTRVFIGNNLYQAEPNHQVQFSLSYQAMKARNLNFQLSARDLLNQGVRNQRNISSNGSIVDTQSNFVSRRFSLRVSYEFRSKPMQNSQK
jgi:hypothetical protein